MVNINIYENFTDLALYKNPWHQLGCFGLVTRVIARYGWAEFMRVLDKLLYMFRTVFKMNFNLQCSHI